MKGKARHEKRGDRVRISIILISRSRAREAGPERIFPKETGDPSTVLQPRFNGAVGGTDPVDSTTGGRGSCDAADDLEGGAPAMPPGISKTPPPSRIERMGWVGLEPTANPESFRGCSRARQYGDQIVGWVGLEPTANALKGRCSTIELPTRAKLQVLRRFGAPRKNSRGKPPVGVAPLGSATRHGRTRISADRKTNPCFIRVNPWPKILFPRDPRPALRVPANEVFNGLKMSETGQAKRPPYNFKRSRNEFCGRASSKTSRPAAFAPAQSRSGSSPTCSTSLGANPLTSSARR